MFYSVPCLEGSGDQKYLLCSLWPRDRLGDIIVGAMTCFLQFDKGSRDSFQLWFERF